MSRDKQLEEMQSEIIRWGENADRTGNYNYPLSEHLITAGYRKAAEVAREIFEELKEKYTEYFFDGTKDIIAFRKNDLAELKKRYTESEDTE